MEQLPNFRYHPDPVATGVVVESDTPCLGCNRIRGYIYTGPVYTEKNFILDEHLCPWCIADGTAAKRFEANFGYTGMIEIPQAAREEIESRTPGFEAWQQEGWLACCGDGAAYLGSRSVHGGDETEYLFRCLHCDQELSYTDEP